MSDVLEVRNLLVNKVAEGEDVKDILEDADAFMKKYVDDKWSP